MAGEDTKGLVNVSPVTPTITVNNVDIGLVEANKVNSKKERGKPFRQIMTSLLVNIGTINTGLMFGFSAVAIPQLQAKDSIIQINENQASWIASWSSAATPFGCIISGYLMDRIGRKKTLLLTEIPLIIGWILIALASDVYMIYFGRILIGFGSGMVGAPARVYTSEVTQPHLRGMLTALAAVGVSAGVLFQYTLGAFVNWQLLSAISALIPISAFIFMIFLPETPNYLVSNSKPNKAAKSLAKLRGSAYNIQKEIDQLQNFTNKIKSTNDKPTFSEIISAIMSPATLKPFFILVTYFMIYQFSGVNAVTFYAVQIFQSSGTTWDKNTCTIFLGIVRLVFTIIACIALRRCGRRPLTFVSGIGCGISMIGLGTYLYFKHQWETSVPPVQPIANWVPVMFLFIFTITCTLGFLVVPWVMIGELYPQKVRGIVGGFTTFFAHLFVFTVVKTYPALTHLLYQYGTYILYGCISLFGTIFFYFFLPETKGRTLQEIEDYFSGRTTSLTSGTKLNNNFNKNLTTNSKPEGVDGKEKLKLLLE